MGNKNCPTGKINMAKQDIIRAFFFAVFFAIGSAAVVASMLSKELLDHYKNRQVLADAIVIRDKLKAIDEDYDVLREQFEKDPNMIDRIAHVELGTGVKDANIVYPSVRAEDTVIIKQALEQISKEKTQKQPIPEWVIRSTEPKKKMTLFAAGSILILISFACFGPIESQKSLKKKDL